MTIDRDSSTIRLSLSHDSGVLSPKITPAVIRTTANDIDVVRMDNKLDVPIVETDSHEPVAQNLEPQLTPDSTLASTTKKEAQPSEDTKAKMTGNTKHAKGKKLSKKPSRSTKDISKKLSKYTKDISSSSSDDSSSESSSSSESEESTDSSSEDEAAKKKRRAKVKKARKLKAKKALSKRKKEEEGTCSDSDDDSSSSEGETRRKKTKAKKARKLKAKKSKSKRIKEEEGTTSDSDDESSSSDGKLQRKKVKTKKAKKSKAKKKSKRVETDEDISESLGLSDPDFIDMSDEDEELHKKNKKAKERKNKKLKKLKGTKAEFIRVDRIWDNRRHMFVVKQTMEDTHAGAYDQYAFNVRRIFDWENKQTGTVVDIKSKKLKSALVHVMGEVKGISLAEDTPSLDPNMIFLYLRELRHYRKELKSRRKCEKKKKKAKEAAVTAKHLKVLIKYLDKDYDEVKKTLYPMLANNTITFDLLWALFKSNDIAYAPTYATEEVPRAFKIEYSNKQTSILKGDYYEVEGRYLENDGKKFGMATVTINVEHFSGPRKISSLDCYPLRYHVNKEALRLQLIERGKKFVSLTGMQYRLQKGMAFYKKNRNIIKVNVNGRVMVDPAIFRRINPNYPVSTPKPEDRDILSESEDEKQDPNSDGSDSGSSSSAENQQNQFYSKKQNKTRQKLIKDEDDLYHVVDVEVDEDGNVVQTEDIQEISGQCDADSLPKFTEEEYLIASPVALGFSFVEKLWVELDVAGIKEIEWNADAFESLVLPEDQKSVVRALVESHVYEASKNIDDVIHGKGRGLVAVLHGPPGTGKTLTAEGIAELLKKPLYMVSVGELGSKGGDLERNFSQIIDIAHSWGALLLLDEADVFLEKREPGDINRNSLVSIFLRLLEYFQGILFLTTNRVVTFDEAFQSRIHIGLRYGELGPAAKKTVWRLFIEKVRALPDVQVADLTEENYQRLSQFDLNGREIKNAVRTAQSLAITEKKMLSMAHLLKVLFVANVFAKDLKGPGYEEALKFYM